MKHFFAFILLVSTLVACNNAPIEGDGKEEKDSANKEQVSMPYNVPTNPDWQPGNLSNVSIAMNALKAYETNNMEALQQVLADSVEFHGDNFSFEGSRDSLVRLLQESRERYTAITINMQDYESVKSKARNQEWVGLWYTETSTQKNGQVDSMFVMDDIQIKNGKVTEIDSKVRRLPKKE